MHLPCQSSMATTELTFLAMSGKCTACYWLMLATRWHMQMAHVHRRQIHVDVLEPEAPVSVTITPMLPNVPDPDTAREERMLENVRCSVALLHRKDAEASPRNGAACPALA